MHYIFCHIRLVVYIAKSPKSNSFVSPLFVQTLPWIRYESWKDPLTSQTSVTRVQNNLGLL